MTDVKEADYVLRTDGSCLDNPSRITGAGMALYEGQRLLHSWGTISFAETNNEAEYSSLIAGLHGARVYGINNILVLNDSELVVNQINGKWRTKNASLKVLRNETRNILNEFDSWELTRVPREENQLVDKIANKYSQLRFDHISAKSEGQC